MDFVDQLQALANRIEKQAENITTEEATKNAFVMPFIQALGYDVFDPTEVVPEYTADVGSKKGEKVDYAIIIEGKPTLLFECKCCDSNLNEAHASQLRRYFHVTSARIGVLTNGKSYFFFSDLEANNIMDEKPFMEINLQDLDQQFLPELKKLTKASFELDKMLTTASELKYVRAIKNVLAEEAVNPSIDLVRYLSGKVYSGIKTQQVLDQFTPIIKKAFKQYVNEKINDRLKSALSSQNEEVTENDNDEVNNGVIESNNGITTTEEEMEGFYIIRAILREVVDVKRIYHRDTKSYFGILLDDNNRKPVCRLHFNTGQKYLGIFDLGKKETKQPIEVLEDIYNHAEKIKSMIAVYDRGNSK